MKRKEWLLVLLVLAAVFLLLLAGCSGEHGNEGNGEGGTESSPQDSSGTEPTNPPEDGPSDTPEDSAAAEEARTALTATLDALVSGDADKIRLIGTDGEPVTGLANEGVSQVICSKLSFAVQNLSADGETATAVVDITAPDVVSAFQKALDETPETEDFDAEAFARNLTDCLEAETGTNIFTVEVQLEQVDGAWYVVPNAAFSNAVTGGLVELYINTVQQIQAGLKGGSVE